jgi:hypothetical protein
MNKNRNFDFLGVHQYLIPIVAMAILGAVLLFPAVNYASSEPETQSTTKQTEHHNRLINESSPYLLQHATNPVDWFPWGTEAFDKAKREDKPVFLSIGYSTCHWCHAMEHESLKQTLGPARTDGAFTQDC